MRELDAPRRRAKAIIKAPPERLTIA